jgi:hypothetical protein
MIVPGSTTIALGTLAKIRQFYDAGGAVIATTRLPSKAAEFGNDRKVQETVRALFGLDPLAPPAAARNSNARGGKALFVSKPTEDSLRRAINECLPVGDVGFENVPRLSGGSLSYLHKVRDGKDLYFVANSSDTAVDTHVRLRGKFALEAWDPHTGAITRADLSETIEQGQALTRVRLVLPPVRSLFLVEK